MAASSSGRHAGDDHDDRVTPLSGTQLPGVQAGPRPDALWAVINRRRSGIHERRGARLTISIAEAAKRCEAHRLDHTRLAAVSEETFVMTITVVAAVTGFLLAAAAIGIPLLVAIRRNHPEDDTDSRAYMKVTGRSAREIAEEDRALQQENDAGSQHGGGSDGPPLSHGAGSRETSDPSGNS
jgi:hypothetical protein